MTNNEIKQELLAKLNTQQREVTLLIDAIAAVDNLDDQRNSMDTHIIPMIEANAELHRTIAKASTHMTHVARS